MKRILGIIVVAIFIMMAFSPLMASNNSIANPSVSSNNIIVYNWDVSGNTYASPDCTNGNSITLEVDVTSYSSSSGAGSTVLMFMVSGNDVHSISIDGTGVYKYTYSTDNKGPFCFDVKYMSQCELSNSITPYKPHSIIGNGKLLLSHPYHVISRHYSTFGGTQIAFAESWDLSGHLSETSESNNPFTLNLEIDVTSYSSSSGAGSTVLMFMVSGNDVHSISIDGTGVYKYTYTIKDSVNNLFYAEYISHNGISDSFSTFGHIQIKFPNEMGYDGNNVIYLSNICHQPTSGIYNQSKLPLAKSEYTGNGFAYRNVIIGSSSFTEGDYNSKLLISLNLTATGAGRQAIQVSKDGDHTYRPDKIIIEIKANNAPYACINMYHSKYGGYNITNMDSKSNKEIQDISSLIADGLSVVPVYGYLVTAAQAAGTAENLVHVVNCKDIGGVSSNDEPSEISFDITGGTYLDKGCQNVYAAGDCALMEIPNSDLGNNFSLTVTYKTEYECGTASNIQTKSQTSQTINAVTASAISGCVLYKSNRSIDSNISIHHLYLYNVGNKNMYKIPIKNGSYLFFAKPDTEYKIYYDNNGNFKLLKTVEGTDLTAGGSYRTFIYSDEL